MTKGKMKLRWDEEISSQGSVIALRYYLAGHS